MNMKNDEVAADVRKKIIEQIASEDLANGVRRNAEDFYAELNRRLAEVGAQK